MKKYKLSNDLDLKDYKDLGWDNNPNTLELFKKRVDKAWDCGWDPNLEPLVVFETKAEKYKSMGWKPTLQTIGRFEDYLEEYKKLGWDGKDETYHSFMKKLDYLLDLGWKETKQNLKRLDDKIKELKSCGWNGRESIGVYDLRVKDAKKEGWTPDIMPLQKFEDIYFDLKYDADYNPENISLVNFFKVLQIAKNSGYDYDVHDFKNIEKEILSRLYGKSNTKKRLTNEDVALLNEYRDNGWDGNIDTIQKMTANYTFAKNRGWDGKTPIAVFMMEEQLKTLDSVTNEVDRNTAIIDERIEYYLDEAIYKFLLKTGYFKRKACNSIIRGLYKKQYPRNVGAVEQILIKHYGGYDDIFYKYAQQIVSIIQSKTKYRKAIEFELMDENREKREAEASILGWDEDEMTLDEFEESQIRRKHAEEAGWDEEEMDLEEFEDYFMK